jgi:hypothetical protein
LRRPKTVDTVFDKAGAGVNVPGAHITAPDQYEQGMDGGQAKEKDHGDKWQHKSGKRQSVGRAVKRRRPD